MQILPSTARLHRAQVGRHRSSSSGDLADPQINIAYGSWYLRYLLDHYDGNERLAVAAYNAGETNVDQLGRDAPAAPDEFRPTRTSRSRRRAHYVASVEEKQRGVPQELRAANSSLR